MMLIGDSRFNPATLILREGERYLLETMAIQNTEIIFVPDDAEVTINDKDGRILRHDSKL